MICGESALKDLFACVFCTGRGNRLSDGTDQIWPSRFDSGGGFLLDGIVLAFDNRDLLNLLNVREHHPSNVIVVVDPVARATLEWSRYCSSCASSSSTPKPGPLGAVAAAGPS